MITPTQKHNIELLLAWLEDPANADRQITGSLTRPSDPGDETSQPCFCIEGIALCTLGWERVFNGTCFRDPKDGGLWGGIAPRRTLQEGYGDRVASYIAYSYNDVMRWDWARFAEQIREVLKTETVSAS